MRNCPKCGATYADDLAYCPNDGTATTITAAQIAAGADSLVGTTIDGRYKVEARIGEGGMGVVYRASHVVLKKALAIKVMRGDQAHDGEVVQRFVQEAQSSSAIGHPNIIGISDFGTTSDGSVYFAMEYLEGQTLSKAMEDGPIERGRAIEIFSQITSALEAAHQRGIVHRDLKPDNLFLIKRNGADFVKILDFGIAKVKNAAAKITRTGMVFGTPHYMSPEQAAGQAVDQRSDIYSLGVIMFQVFAGQLPFDAESYMGVMTKHMFDPPPHPSTIQPALRGSIEDIILMSLAKKPEQRYQSMLAINEDLERLRRGERVSASDYAAIGGETRPFSTPPSQKAVPASARASRELGDRETEPALPSEIAEALELPIRKQPVWLWPVAGLIGAIVAFALFASGKNDGTSSTPAAPAHQVQPATIPAPAAPSAATETTPTPLSAQKQVHVSVSPATAQIEVDGVVVGRGEADVERPRQGHLRLEARQTGYFAKSAELDAQSPDMIRLALDPEPAQASEKPRVKPAQAQTKREPPVSKPAPSAAPTKPARRAGGLNDVVDPWQ